MFSKIHFSLCLKKVVLFQLRSKAIKMVFENHRKVSLNIASEASYVYILSGQKLI